MYPVLSRIQPWLRNKLRSAESHFIEECQWSAHEEALALCSNQRLHQTVYFLNRDLTFMRELPVAYTDLVSKQLDRQTKLPGAVGSDTNCTKCYSNLYHNSSFRSQSAGILGREGSSTHNHNQVANVEMDQLLSSYLELDMECHVFLWGEILKIFTMLL
ncbi:hypothetical protein C0J52_14202 [Blattella germanica]|nr:hypothetical protein C0J52_14202 [Blattella germanica]